MKVVNVIRVARSIHFESLKVGNELLEVWLPINTEDINAGYGSRRQITHTDDQQVNYVLVEGILGLDEPQTELPGQL